MDFDGGMKGNGILTTDGISYKGFIKDVQGKRSSSEPMSHTMLSRKRSVRGPTAGKIIVPNSFLYGVRIHETA